jgi:hypothetical protein
MLRPPKRAVTRFFIPLIDVLILLFCIFLLMPYVEKGAIGGARLTAGEAQKLKERIQELERKLELAEKTRETPEDLKQQIASLKKKLQANPADRLVVKYVYVDEIDGTLFYWKRILDSAPLKIRLDQEKVRQMVADDRKPPFRQIEDKLLYHIVRPQSKSPFPEKIQLREYVGWFAGLPVEFRLGDALSVPEKGNP